MIAKDLLDYLGEALSVGVYMGRNDHIITTTIAVQSYAPSLYEAMVLNESVKSAMEGFAQLANVTRVELDTDYNFTNTVTKQYRWQAVYNITHY